MPLMLRRRSEKGVGVGNGLRTLLKKLIVIAMDKQMRETLRLAAIAALWQLKPEAATQPMLLLMFSDETSPIIRANAVKVLSRIQAPETTPVLIWVLSTQFDEISDFQRHMKREYKTLDALRTQVESFQVAWDSRLPAHKLPHMGK